MIQGKWYPSGSDLSVPLQLRQTVFSQGKDEKDEWAQQVVVFDMEDKPAGTARLSYENGAFVIDLLGVIPSKRHQGFGDLLIRLCLFKALTHHASLVQLSAPESAVSFFTRYGFRAASHAEGKNVLLSISAQDIHLDHCNGHCDGCH